MIDWERLVTQLVETIVFVALGLGLFALAYFLIQKLTPFSLRKEIEEDQNIALGIVLGSVILGIAIIVSAAMRG